ncbi:hypothetical protein BKP35_06460 [Anaerobacillus arseniciselenatis]|uniref:Uncharacterized protein n=2 Tax=Anaerobacillus arseniciselenatis TaxID=85682 RepID=A0A1S2LS82_9BACI|nr:hypothetical protein BKP35_06460 [Anaerobacillus arseniciselenatis]
MKVKILAVIGLLSALLVVGCSADGNDESNAEVNEVDNIKELVHDHSMGNIEGQVARINSHQLIVTEGDENEYLYNLPEDEFFVSIAPYINFTHP